MSKHSDYLDSLDDLSDWWVDKLIDRDLDYQYPNYCGDSVVVPNKEKIVETEEEWDDIVFVELMEKAN